MSHHVPKALVFRAPRTLLPFFVSRSVHHLHSVRSAFARAYHLASKGSQGRVPQYPDSRSSHALNSNFTRSFPQLHFQHCRYLRRTLAFQDEKRKLGNLSGSAETPPPTAVPEELATVPMTNWEKFKDMYKKYWYVLIPVHAVTSSGWAIGLYYLVKSGVDVVPLLEKLSVPESLMGPIRKSGPAAYVAAAYALYHLLTPLRYSLTLGLTTVSITYLKRLGYIKPVPSRDEMKQFFKDGQQRIMASGRFSKNKTKSLRAQDRLKKAD